MNEKQYIKLGYDIPNANEIFYAMTNGFIENGFLPHQKSYISNTEKFYV